MSERQKQGLKNEDVAQFKKNLQQILKMSGTDM
jgi:hypothetical protein